MREGALVVDGVFLGFDFGYKRIGVAVGQSITVKAQPLKPLQAQQGIPQWIQIKQLIQQWNPQGFVVGIPCCIDDKPLYTTDAAHRFANQLLDRFCLPVYRVDERLTTVAARAELFNQGGYKKLKTVSIDSIAACLILEQWLQYPEDTL